MGLHAITLSDVGEGVAEAELIEWHVAVGDLVSEDQLLAVVMTDKAAVEVPSSVDGRVAALAADVGDVVAVGAELLRLEVEGDGMQLDDLRDKTASSSSDAQPAHQSRADVVEGSGVQTTAGLQRANQQSTDQQATEHSLTQQTQTQHLETERHATEHSVQLTQHTQTSAVQKTSSQTGQKPLAAPSVRMQARERDIDLYQVTGSGPGGRILHEDLDDHANQSQTAGAGNKRVANTNVDVIKMIGMRRKIAHKMSLSKRHIPHITIVEEVDVNYLEELRSELNERHAQTRAKLTILPFVMKAIVEAVREQPVVNAHFDDEAETILQYGGVHIGIATQTPNGLVVPVIKHAEVNSLWDNASGIVRLSKACRNNAAARDELSGSTITITSLGPLGAIATTPIINHPEVAIVGINKIAVRPFWDGQQFVPRKIMNISCSFDHRVVDGWDAAVFVQKIKALLEKPAMLFMED